MGRASRVERNCLANVSSVIVAVARARLLRRLE